jgi:hypothetical protein
MMKRFRRLRQRAKNIAASSRHLGLLGCALNSILGGVATFGLARPTLPALPTTD